MTEPTIIVFDDRAARDWEPFALTRPIGELLFGALTFRARHEHVFRGACVGHLTAAHLAGFQEPGAPPTLTGPLAEAAPTPRLYLSSRYVPAFDAALPTGLTGAGPLVLTTGESVGWFDPMGDRPPPEHFILDGVSGDRTPVATLDGTRIEHVWDLVSANPDQVAIDILALASAEFGTTPPDGCFHWGEHPFFIGPGATVEPGSAFDTSAGPIWLDRDSHVRAFSRVAGPVYLGRGSTLLGGAVEAVSIGPVCRIRGEFAESVCLGYVNKQHDGHIGHAYLGRWVNLGAETTNSDLKNNYGTIHLWTPGGARDTGLIKMGSLLGDHVKTGIGLLLNTGTVIGAGSNLYGSAMPPTFVPPFSWGTGDDLTEYRLDKFIDTTEKAMGRRGIELSGSMREQLAAAWRRGRAIAGNPIDGAM